MSVLAPDRGRSECPVELAAAPPQAKHGLFSAESEMTTPAIAASHNWWAGRSAADAVAREIVGPGAIADLVGIRFDRRALKARRKARIEPLIDALALQLVLATRRRAMSTRELADRFRVSPSGARRAIRIAIDKGAMVDTGRAVAVHPEWQPIGQRMVAVELKLHDWRRAFAQAVNYQGWASAAWVVLGRAPSEEALLAARRAGIGLGYFLGDSKVRTLVRARSRERLRSGDWASVWAAEQVLAEVEAGSAELPS